MFHQLSLLLSSPSFAPILLSSLLGVWVLWRLGVLDAPLVRPVERGSAGSLMRRLVVVTGCDSGFGLQVAALLSGVCGVAVVAVCLTQEGADQLNARGISGLHAVRGDVTSDEDVERVAAVVESLCNDDV